MQTSNAYDVSTADGANTILADIGGMGASTDIIAVYRLDRGTITAAKFKDQKGNISQGGLFLEGSSATHSASVTLSSTQKALFTSEINGIDETDKAQTCKVHAYQWIPGLKMYVERASRKSDEVQCKPSYTQ